MKENLIYEILQIERNEKNFNFIHKNVHFNYVQSK